MIFLEMRKILRYILYKEFIEQKLKIKADEVLGGSTNGISS